MYQLCLQKSVLIAVSANKFCYSFRDRWEIYIILISLFTKILKFGQKTQIGGGGLKYIKIVKNLLKSCPTAMDVLQLVMLHNVSPTLSLTDGRAYIWNVD